MYGLPSPSLLSACHHMVTAEPFLSHTVDLPCTTNKLINAVLGPFGKAVESLGRRKLAAW